MKQLILHPGMPKTGTTALQHFLSSNSEKLQGQGITYYGYQGLDRSHDFLARLAYKQQWKRIDEFMRDLASRVVSGGKAILSGGQFFAHASMRAKRQRDISLVELSWNIERDRCAKFFEIVRRYFPAVKVVVFLRRQDRALEASYNQSIKNGSWKGGGIMEFYNYLKNRFAYDQILDIWAAELGNTAIHAAIYERERMLNNDIRTEFCSLLKIKTDQFSFENPEPASENIRLPRDILEYKAVLNRIEMPKWKMHLYTRAIRKVAMDMGGELERWQSFLTREECLKVMEAAAEGNRRLAVNYFHINDPTPFTMTDVQNRADTDLYPGLTVEAAMEIHLRFEREMASSFYRIGILIRTFQDWISHRFPYFSNFMSPRKLLYRSLRS